jgi:hypothetical protein
MIMIMADRSQHKYVVRYLVLTVASMSGKFTVLWWDRMKERDHMEDEGLDGICD